MRALRATAGQITAATVPSAPSRSHGVPQNGNPESLNGKPGKPQRNRAWQWLWSALVSLCVLVLISMPGCSCSENGGAPDPDAPWGGYGSKEAWLKATAGERKKEEEGEAKQAAKPAEKKPEPAKAPPAGAAPPPALPAPAVATAAGDTLPNPPAEYAVWTEGDYLVARVRRSPALFDALDAMACEGRDDEQAAILLGRLLQFHYLACLWEAKPASKARPTVADSQAANSPRRSYNDRLVDAILAALVRNGAPAARWTLGRLLTGNIEAREKDAIALATLRGLSAELDRKECESLVFTLLAEPERLGPPGADGFALEPVRREALRLVEPVATSEFRLRAARHLTQPGMRPETGSLLGALVAAPARENLEAQVHLFQADAGSYLPQDWAHRFAEHASAALRAALRLSPKPEPSAHAEEAAWARRVAQQMWSPSFHAALESRLGRAGSLDQIPGPLALAGALPTDAMRKGLDALLAKHWLAGPGPLAEAWAAEGTVTDPGLLVVLQSRLLEQPDDPDAVRAVLASGDARAETLARQRAEAREAWYELARKMTTVWLGRCHAAATAGEADGPFRDRARALAELPIALHGQDHIVATWRLDWPEDNAAEMGDATVSPLRVQYVRMEETARPDQLLALYRRRFPGAEPQRVPGGARLTMVVPGTSTGARRTVDLEITLAVPGAATLSSEPQAVVVELLAVEI